MLTHVTECGRVVTGHLHLWGLRRDARTCRPCPGRKSGRVSLLWNKDWGGDRGEAPKERKAWKLVRVDTAQDSMEME